MTALKHLSVSAVPSRITKTDNEHKSQITFATLKQGWAETLPSASKPVFLPVQNHPDGLEMSKNCALSQKERELMQIFGRLPFSFECDWDKRLEPAA
jgi:hypothetical protein